MEPLEEVHSMAQEGVVEVPAIALGLLPQGEYGAAIPKVAQATRQRQLLILTGVLAHPVISVVEMEAAVGQQMGVTEEMVEYLAVEEVAAEEVTLLRL
jgi:hypothetical protein